MIEELKEKFKGYIEQINPEEIADIWLKQSKQFTEFWKEKIMSNDYPTLTDTEIDDVVLILDKNAKGSTKETHAVAKAMIPQGVWRRLFNEIKENKELKLELTKLFTSKSDDEKIKIINKIYEINKGKKNSLTGKSGNAINCMLFAYSPTKYLAIVSLNDRKKIIEHYKLSHNIDFENDSQGKKIIETNKAIIEGFHSLGIQTTSRILSQFMYDVLKEEWKNNEDILDSTFEDKSEEEYRNDEASFYMEKELENFLIANWDKTELSKEYELIEENGDLISQQFRTDIGIIDILVQDKKTKQLVVIELKRRQTSDDTIGQILRYMGWLEEHKSNGQSVKGIIIASKYDKKLYYALKRTKDIQVYNYKINFSLTEFKE